MKEIFHEAQCQQEMIQTKKVAILGYGSQGRAHALNLKESGVQVAIGLYEGSASALKAEADGFSVWPVSEAVKWADVSMVLLPDEKQKVVLESEVLPHLTEGKALAFAHGFNIHYQLVSPPAYVDVFMVAPKGPGHLVRRVYEEGKGVPALFAVHQDATGKTKELAMAYAGAIGASRAGVLETTFKDETESDLFGEQAVLCGGVTELIKAGFDTLTEAGYEAEIAYFECLHEMKLIVDLLYEGGMEAMRHSISDTAEYGDYVSGKRIINQAVRQEMKAVLSDIQSGQFARQWIEENQSGRAAFTNRREEELKHPIVETGKNLRQMMTWMK